MLFACNDPMAFPCYPCYLKFLPPAWPLYLQCLPLPGPYPCNVYPCLALYLLLYWLLYLQCLPLPGPCTCNVYPCLAPVPAMFTPAWPLYLQCLPLPGPCTCNVYGCRTTAPLTSSYIQGRSCRGQGRSCRGQGRSCRGQGRSCRGQGRSCRQYWYAYLHTSYLRPCACIAAVYMIESDQGLVAAGYSINNIYYRIAMNRKRNHTKMNIYWTKLHI